MNLTGKLMGAFALTATLGGCMGSNGELPRGTAPRIGAATGAIIGTLGRQSDDSTVRAISPIIGGVAGYMIGQALEGPPPACNRQITINNRTGQVISDTSNCRTQHGLPAGTPVVVYR